MSRNNREVKQVRDRVRKAKMVMGWVWSLGERRFSGDIKWRMKLFDSLVKSVVMYGVEIWGYREWEEIEGLQERYIRWVLGLDRWTPGYICREELKRGKMRIEASIRAGKFEEKLGEGVMSEVGRECWRERKERENEESEWTKESVERQKYMWRCGVSEEALEELGERKWEWMMGKDREVDSQERGIRIEKSKACKRYERIRVEGIPRYIKNAKKNEGKKVKLIARWRCGNEEGCNRYWMGESHFICRICRKGNESLEHIMKECEGMERMKGRVEEVLNDDGTGYAWMNEVQRKRRERNVSESAQ